MHKIFCAYTGKNAVEHGHFLEKNIKCVCYFDVIKNICESKS